MCCRLWRQNHFHSLWLHPITCSFHISAEKKAKTPPTPLLRHIRSQKQAAPATGWELSKRNVKKCPFIQKYGITSASSVRCYFKRNPRLCDGSSPSDGREGGWGGLGHAFQIDFNFRSPNTDYVLLFHSNTFFGLFLLPATGKLRNALAGSGIY